MGTKNTKKGDTKRDYIDGVRRTICSNIEGYIANDLKTRDYNEILNSMMLKRDGYSKAIEEDDIVASMPLEDYIELNSYIADLYLAKNCGAESLKPYITKIKDRLVQKYSSRGEEWGLYVYSNIVDGRLDVYADSIGEFQSLGASSYVLILLSLYVTSYLTKLRNFKAQNFYTNGHCVKLKYSNLSLIDNNDIATLNSLKGERVLQKIICDLDIKSSNFSVEDVAQEYMHLCSPVSFYLTKDFKTLPFWTEDELSISLDTLRVLPRNRKYAVPTAGIRFEFTNKSKGINSIEMKEIKGKMVFCVELMNHGGIAVTETPVPLSEIKKNEGKYRYTNDIFVVPLIIRKSLFDKENWSLKDISLGAKYFTFTPLVLDECSSVGLMKIAYHCLCCMYIALYNPGMFKDILSMYTINRLQRGRFDRKESYRIAHLRKLPKGQNISNDAKLEAIKNGFDYIEEGYTFVRASNVNLQSDEKKVISVTT